jgi:prepilin-type N-terminal cleavage/methylation domain-containing protein
MLFNKVENVKESGFTLIEIMVALALSSILAIALVQLFLITDKT